MISNDRFDRELTAALGDLAPLRQPDYLPDILGLAARTRQRPAWASFERWIPMDLATKVATAPIVPWRRLALLAALALVLAATTVVLVGSKPDTPAPPFGLASNGFVAYETDGDIFVTDPSTGATNAIATGPAKERMPQWSPDGTRLAFVREVDGGYHVVVARPDGASPTVVTPEPIGLVGHIAFSPDGKQLVIAARRGVAQALALASPSGDRFEWLETAGPATKPVFRPPDGAELLFVTGQAFAGGQALQSMDVASRTVTELVGPRQGGEFTGVPQYSPDGRTIAYSYWISGTPSPGVVDDAELLSRIHVVDADGAGEPVRIPVPDGICCDGYVAWSNDGTRLAFGRWYDPEGQSVVVVPWETGGEGRSYEVPSLTTPRLTWSPDDRFLLVTPLDGSDRPLDQVLIDVETGDLVEIQWTTTSDPAWQRLPPP